MKISSFFANERDPENVPVDWWFERFRNYRAIQLSQSDWTQLPDAPVDAIAWALYRQKLRDLPDSKDFANVELPERPL